MGMEEARDYKAEAKALKYKRGLSDRELSKLASVKKYQEDNRQFIKRKGKIANDICNKQIEMFEYLIQLQLIPIENFTDILTNGIADIEELKKRLRLLKQQKAEERYKFNKTK